MLLMVGSLVACTVDTQEAPPLAGPSAGGQSLSLTASPDRILHNGTSQSVVTLSVTDDIGQPVSGQRVSVGTSAGTVSHVDVVTGSDGRAMFIVTAPALSTPAREINVVATPFGSNADNALTRLLTIAFTGPQNRTAPSPSIAFIPAQPAAGEGAGLDASGTTDEGEVCGSACSYSWTFGDGATGTGMVVSHTYGAQGSYAVGLTVVDSTGTVASTQKIITVVAPTADEED
jgi:hypothetical protein